LAAGLVGAGVIVMDDGGAAGWKTGILLSNVVTVDWEAGMEMFPIENTADEQAEGDGCENEAAEVAFPKRIETMDVHMG
jgi:hypothetical protein